MEFANLSCPHGDFHIIEAQLGLRRPVSLVAEEIELAGSPLPVRRNK